MTVPSAATDFSVDLELALRLADAADSESLPRFDASDLKISTKEDRSHVTDADLAAERALRAILADERPSDGIFGEEFGIEGDAKRQWIIDPIDGTANFMRGIPLWGTMIALAVDGVPQVGVVSMPALGRRWWGSTGAGAWTATHSGPRRLEASSIASLDDAAVSFQSITQWADAGHLPALLKITDRVWRDRAYGDVYAYMLLAEGRLEMVAEFDVKEYDIAAAVPIVREAGGTFTSFDGADSISERSSLATNGILHDAFRDLIGAKD
ncbi:inositol monophosphatase family protein [Microbacterium sp.]|uniref:inositol monophosphatase family protein n=1 Tax=Microbacterium sp. TaxID=51671 RepID=UPI003F96C3E9